MLRAIPAILTVARRIHAFGASRTPAQFDCTIRYWNEALQKERTHDYDTGYSTTKVAPSDIAWLQPGMSPVGRPGPSRSPHSRICCTQLVLEGQYHQQHRAPKYYDQVEVN